MVIVNFEIGNKEFEVRSIPESGYPPTNNERGSMLVEYDVTTFMKSSLSSRMGILLPLNLIVEVKLYAFSKQMLKKDIIFMLT